MITDEIKQRLKKIDIREYLKDTCGTTYNGNSCRCPHKDHNDSNPSFNVWTDKNGNYSWCCFGCHDGSKDLSGDRKNYGSDIIALIQWLSDYKGSSHVYSFREAAEIAARYAGIDISCTPISRYLNEKLAGNKSVANACNKNLLLHYDSEAFQYLASRGLDRSDIERWCLGFNGERITFPLFNRSREVVAFSNRTVGNADGEAKYINSSNSELFHKSEYLYGIHRLDASLDYVYITEGQLDVIAAYKYGLKNVLAPLGKAFTEKHAEMLGRYNNLKHVIIVFDGDNPGRESVPKAAAIARKFGFSVSYARLPDGYDLFDYAMEKQSRLDECIHLRTNYYFFYELEKCAMEFDSIMLALKSRVMELSGNISNQITGDKERAMFDFYLKTKFRIEIPECASGNVKAV